MHSDDYFRNPPGCRLGALAAIRNPDGHLPLVNKRYLQARGDLRTWGMVGGSVNEHERLREGWIREVREETGLDLEPGRLLVLDDVPASEHSAKGLNVVYDGGMVDRATTIVLPEDELSECRFVAPGDFGQFLTEHGARRALAVMHALQVGGTIEQVHGHTVADRPTEPAS